MAYIEGTSREQIMLFPESIDDYITEDNPVRFIDAFVENIISKQMENDQFLNANITFKEIQSIKKVLKRKLANIYHLRIEYPE